MARRRRDDPSPLGTKREQFLECVFVADRSEYRFHFRAWTPEEAAQHLAADLGENGVDVAGEIHVLDPRGRVVATLAYAPAGPAPRARNESA